MSWPGPSDASECQVHNGTTRNFGVTVPNGLPKKSKTAERIKIFRQWLADTDEDERKMLIRELLFPFVEVPVSRAIGVLYALSRCCGVPSVNSHENSVSALLKQSRHS
ncbi:unnamed protein product [Nippostrongylus brasiliensis]|uniref:Uncharacterized protein n=1 Tax=Nippostrongylus brasiliensis TaxID=27835 RepID=A0A0N4YP88_NIPBR|nr:unnamed protein product [Nippostrongylus brasiliensis]